MPSPPPRTCSFRAFGAVWALALAGCLGTADDELGVTSEPLAARCEVRVEGTGVVPVETDYIPSVIRCENGSADFEGLKALAVAARSVLYYKLERGTSVADGTGTQVYSCSRPIEARHRRAAEETSGLVLRYHRTQVFGFHVAGARQSAPTCRGGSDDPYDTERYVTYNRGRSGTDVHQTTLGWVDPANYANRGCLSQNGSSCLSTTGMGFTEILHYYYGADVEIVRAEGSCIVEPEPPPPPEPPDAGAMPEPEPDAGDTPSEVEDAGALPLGDDAAVPPADASSLPLGRLGSGDRSLHGGCSASGTGSPRGSSAFALAFGACAFITRARRLRRRHSRRPSRDASRVD